MALRLVPGIDLITSYDKSWLRPDLLAGLTVWAMLVPQAMGYAALAGMPTVTGLYAAIGGLALYWLWGTSRELNVGPESTVAIMVATILQPFAPAGSDDYLAYAAALGLLVGLVLAIGGIFRLGRVADFLSRPILAGYVFGSGVLIVVSQLPDLFGITVDTSLYATDIGAIVGALGDLDPVTTSIGVGSLAAVLVLKATTRQVPGALVAVVGATALVWLLNLDVAVVGEFERGIPIPALPALGIGELARLIGPAVAIALLVYPDSVLTARSLSTVGRYPIDADREFFGIGAANIGAGLLGGFPVNGSQSRSFVLADAGARSQVSNLWAIAFTLLTLAILAPIFAYLPSAALAGVVLAAGIALLDVAEFRTIWRYRKSEFWMAAGTVAAVLFLGMLAGILVAIALSLLVVVMRASSPHTAILGQVAGTDTFRDITSRYETAQIPGLLIFRFDAPLFFANASRLRTEILEATESAAVPVRTTLIDAEMISDIDSTGSQVMLELLDDLDRRGIALTLARVRTEILDELQSIGIEERLAGDGIYLEVDDGVAAFLRNDGRSPNDD